MIDERTRELLEALREMFSYNFPVYRDSLLANDGGLETFEKRVKELLKTKDNHVPNR